MTQGPSGLSSWDDVRVRYEYYKGRGYLRDLDLQVSPNENILFIRLYSNYTTVSPTGLREMGRMVVPLSRMVETRTIL